MRISTRVSGKGMGESEKVNPSRVKLCIADFASKFNDENIRIYTIVIYNSAFYTGCSKGLELPFYLFSG